MRRTLWPLAALAMIALIGVISTGCSKAPSEISTGSNSDANREKAMQFAQCMRDNGVSEFPDPDASGALTIDAIANGSSLDTDSAAFKQALSACKDLQPAGFTGHKRTAQQQEEALKFAQCMRDNGVKDFPDPGPDDPLVNTYRIPSSNTTAGMSALNAAMQTCGDLAEQAMGQ